MRYIQQNGILVPQTSRTRQRGFIVCGPAFFGAPASSGGDPYWSDVLSLLYFNGTNGSTTITDQVAGVTWGAHGSVALSSSALPYADSTTSLNMVGTSGNYLLSGKSAGYWAPMVQSSTSWTVDYLIRISSTPTATAVIVDLGGVATNSHGTALCINPSNKIRFMWSNNVSGTYLADLSLGTVVVNTFTLASVEFIASVGAHGTFYMYQEGVLLGSHALPSAATSGAPANTMYIGAYAGTNGLNFPGFHGQARFTTVARYGGASFTPPTDYFPNHA